MERLDRRAWVEAALAALAEGGAAAVKVERLAARLKVTKGSFYWHFRDRDDLHDAMLEAWAALATHAIIEEVDAGGGDGVARLRALMEILARFDGGLDRAVRAWAAHDEAPKRALAVIDRRRLDYVASLFRAMDFSEAEALARARLLYQALVGQFAMGETWPLRERLDIVLPMLARR